MDALFTNRVIAELLQVINNNDLLNRVDLNENELNKLHNEGFDVGRRNEDDEDDEEEECTCGVCGNKSCGYHGSEF